MVHAETKTRAAELETRLLRAEAADRAEGVSHEALARLEKENAGLARRLETTATQLGIAASKASAAEKELALLTVRLPGPRPRPSPPRSSSLTRTLFLARSHAHAHSLFCQLSHSLSFTHTHNLSTASWKNAAH